MYGLIALLIFVVVCVVYLIVKALGQAESPTPDASGRLIAYHGKSYPFSEISDDPNFPQVRTIRTKIRGVTKSNPDGVNRQHIIRQWCHSGDALYLAREPNNPFDSNAIQVRRIVGFDVPDKPRLGEQIGYLSRELAEELAPRMDNDGFVLMAEILNVTGDEDGESVGVNIVMAAYMPALKATHQPQLG